MLNKFQSRIYLKNHDKSNSEHLIRNQVHKQYLFVHQFALINHWVFMRKSKIYFYNQITQDSIFEDFFVAFGMFCTYDNLSFGFVLSKKHMFILTYVCVKVYDGVFIVLCIFFNPLEPRINCLVIREWSIALFQNPFSWFLKHWILT